MTDLRSIATQARAGDPHAFAVLVDRFQDMAVGYAQTLLGDFHLAQDAAQEAFVEAHRKLSQMRDPQAFAGWLRRIVFKQCDRRWRKSTIALTSLDQVEEPATPYPRADEKLETDAMEATAIEALGALPQEERTVATLHYISAYSHQEIADFLNIPATTVNYRLRRARQQMRERMEQMAKDALRKNAPSRDKTFKATVARMVQPAAMKTSTYHAGNDFEAVDGNDGWALMQACAAGDLPAIRTLLDKDPRLANITYWYQFPIHMAVRYGHVDTVSMLLDAGADAGYSIMGDIYAWDHLLAMAQEREYDAVHALLVHALQERFNYQPAFEAVGDAILARDRTQLESLLADDPDLVRGSDAMGNTGLHWAVMTRQTELIDFFLERGVALEARRADGQTPLEVSLNCDAVPGEGQRSWFRNRNRPLHPETMHNRWTITGYLLAKGADYTLSAAAALGDLGCVLTMLERDPKQAKQLSPAGRSPLFYAAEQGHTAIVRRLLEGGADPNRPEQLAPRGRALHAACSFNYVETARLLLEHDADLNASVDSSGDCYGTAEYRGHETVLELLRSYGAEEAGLQRFTDACAKGDLERVRRKLAEDPAMAEDVRGFDLACRGGHQQVITLMLEHNPDLLHSNDQLFRAAIPTLRLLLERGANPDLTDWLGVSALHRLAELGDVERAKVFLDYGADINARDADYLSTPLAWAARTGQAEMAAFLLARGAKPTLPDDPPWATPLAWAKKRGHDAVVDLLQKT